MKREKIIYLGLTLLIGYLVIIDKNLINKAEQETKTYSLSELKLTRIDVPCEVYLTEGQNQKMVIEAPENLFHRINSKTNNGILTISASLDRKLFGLFNVKDKLTDRVKIFINHDQLDRIIVSDQAKIISVDYKPIGFHASNEQEQIEKKFFNVSLPEVHFAELGLIDVIPLILNSIQTRSL